MSSSIRPTSKLASIAVIPAVFVLSFLLAFVAMGVADALAQPAEPTAPTEAATPTEAAEPTERPPHGFAQPNEGPELSDAEKARLAHEAAGASADPHAAHGAHGEAAGAHGEHAAGHGEHAAGHGDPTQHFNFFNFSYRGKDVAGGRFGDGKNEGPHGVVAGDEEAMSAPFVLMVVNFLLLMGILVWKGGPAANKIAAERHDQIKSALDEAAKLRSQAADKLAEYETRLKDADAEIARMVEGMRKDAEMDKVRILDNAAKQSAQMKREAEQRIAAEIELARANLTREVTAAAGIATEKLLREKMMPGDQANLVSQFISGVQASQAGGSAKERA